MDAFLTDLGISISMLPQTEVTIKDKSTPHVKVEVFDENEVMLHTQSMLLTLDEQSQTSGQRTYEFLKDDLEKVLSGYETLNWITNTLITKMK